MSLRDKMLDKMRDVALKRPLRNLVRQISGGNDFYGDYDSMLDRRDVDERMILDVKAELKRQNAEATKTQRHRFHERDPKDRSMWE